MRSGRILINGAGGFLGSHTVEAFAEAGYGLRVTDVPGANLEWARRLGAEVVPADLRDFGAACELTKGVQGVVNVAGLFDFGRPYRDLYAANVAVTENMCRASLEAGVQKFVQIASVAVYGTPAYTPIDEGGPKRPKNDYERTKKLGEDVAFAFQRQYGLPATSLRPAPIYGPRSRYIHNLMFATASLMATSPKAKGVSFADGALCNHVHVRDVARACVLLTQLPRTVGNAYNCADLTPIRWNELFDIIGECVGVTSVRKVPWSRAAMRLIMPALLRIWPQAQLERGNAKMKRAWDKVVARRGLVAALTPRLERDMFAYMAADHVYDTTALRELGFEWEYPDIREGIRETHRWLVEQRWIPGDREMRRGDKGMGVQSGPPGLA